MSPRESPFRWLPSIRARLTLGGLAIVLTGFLVGWWLHGLTLELLLGTLIVSAVAVLIASWAFRGMDRRIKAVQAMAHDLEHGRPVQVVASGIVECDAMAHALAQASASILGKQVDLEERVAQAVALSRSAEERLSHHQRLEALGRLTGGVAHDFNNLLGVISNTGHLLLRKSSDPHITASVEVTLRAVEAGSRLTQHLLRFAGRQSVKPCVIPLAIFLPEAAELIRALIGRRIEITVTVEPSTPSVFADPNELELALINLALNAREAIVDRGKVTLHAAPASADDVLGLPGQGHVVVSVTDDGGGISDTVVQRVFEPFFTTKGLRQATGLGLSQVYGFCQQSGGTVRLHSTLGMGTSVSMVLPTPGAAEPVNLAPHRVELPPIKGTRVLLVEDHSELREVTSSLLASFGCDVVCSVSAQDALRILKNAVEIDIVLTDVLMPGPMNGVSLARHVFQRFPGLPVVMISGHCGDVEDLDEFPFVKKPYTPETLITALQRAMWDARQT